MMASKPCFSFQRGQCRYGERCRYSHDKAVTNANPASATNRSSREESKAEADCRKWTYMIPSLNTRFPGVVDTQIFFEMGWNLIETEDAGVRQHVITKLGTETGLAIIKTLTDSMNASLNDASIVAIFKNRTLPFFRIISQPSVLSSLILETPVDTIYTYLFGPSGRRGLGLFRSTATALSEMILAHSSSNEIVSGIAVSSSLAVLHRMIDINQSAQVIEDFTTIIDTMSACIPESLLVPDAQRSLTRIKQRLNIGAALPTASTQVAQSSSLSAVFELSQDLPGTLSTHGPRHDNDHDNIVNIQILPTAEEIASIRQEYIPTVDTTQHHLPGLAGLLDRQFRLLREDTVGQLRDAAREEVARLEFPNRKEPTKQRGQQGVRRSVYHNVRFSRVSVDHRNGLQVVAEFDQPHQVKNKSMKQRDDWWRVSKLLQVDSLVCFVASDGKIIFLSVCDTTLPFKKIKDYGWDHERKSEDAPSLSRHANRASVLLSLAEFKMADAVWLSTHTRPSKSRQSIVEFPGVLLPSFKPTLQALQIMSQKLDLPFADIVAEGLHASAAIIKPPAYAAKRGFSFDLHNLVGRPLTLTLGQAFDFATLEAGSTLDNAQQIALIHALSTELALIQGPPGTGKSYTGVAIIKTLLQNRVSAGLGPVVCVCYTNHALDQLLEHLVQEGVNQVIRLGSRSKSEILQNLTIHHVRKGIVPTKTEKHDKWLHNSSIETLLGEIKDILSRLDDPKSLTNIRNHLDRCHRSHFKQLFGKGVDEDGFKEVKGKRFKVVQSWLRGAPKKLSSERSVDKLSAIPLKEMSTPEREAIYQNWIEQERVQLTNDLTHALESYRRARHALDKCHMELDLRCLSEAQIIGVTTSGLARNIDLLRRVGAKVMLCEEAGEVLEAHTLTAFLPGVEHAILIGDHEQLRPQINNYDLQHDSPNGRKYSLDISLFERLVRGRAETPQVPLSSLQVQRRMHPSISELVRVPLYPDLQDHSSVYEHPEVDGMRHRLYWLDHPEKEDVQPAQTFMSSKSNTFEVEMTAALVSHLVRQGTYASEDIAVITPYLGQLQKLKKRLAESFEIVVGDRDQDVLEAQGLQDDPETSAGGHVQVQKTTLLSALRIATVDNFQGEEAKVVVVSLVRSNAERRCGFLKTSNRINVLLSRAKHGMYIIGNSNTSRHVPMWAEVLSILERTDRIGPSLALCCARHTETSMEVAVPDDFVRLAPEGGCALRCSSRLSCGHSCPNMCHSTSLHNAVRCLERCQRIKTGCEHECPRPCGDPCESRCQVMVHDIPLPCGHIAKRLRCYEAQIPAEVQCQVETEEIMKHCNHKIRVKCHELPLIINYTCSAICGWSLICGHNCMDACQDCNTRSEGLIVETAHGVCRTRCARPYTTCGHSCEASCHDEKPCPLCTQPCEVSCNHSKCPKLCHEPCVPCAQDCSRSCPHHERCPLPCAVPCDLLPCSERCAEKLACGHRCPSVCGEVCPDVAYCQLCANTAIKETVVDFIIALRYEEVDLDDNPCIIPSCGHIITRESMDGHMSMSDFYITNGEGMIANLKGDSGPFSASEMKSCPTCRGPLRNLNRYSRIVRRALIDESTKKFIVWANQKFVPLTEKMAAMEKELRDALGSETGVSDKLPPDVSLSKPIRLSGTRDQQISRIEGFVRKEQRYATLLGLRREIKKFLQQVNEKEQPFGRIYDLVQDARRHRQVDSDFQLQVEILQVHHRLLTTALLIRCDYAVLFMFLNARRDENSAIALNIQLDLSVNRADCEALVAESEARKQPGNYVEGVLHWVRFFALERRFAEDRSELTPLLEQGRQYLELAQTTCDMYPGQTPGMREEVKEAEKMLRDSTFYTLVSNEEKAAVYTAMASDFRGTGHWYYCENGHPFTIGECGMPMETSICPQCGSPVGGQSHRAVEGVRRATDLEEQFGRLGI